MEDQIDSYVDTNLRFYDLQWNPAINFPLPLFTFIFYRLHLYSNHFNTSKSRPLDYIDAENAYRVR